MARMPQIPQPELSGRPGGNIGARTELPDARAAQEPLESGSKLLEGVGGLFEKLQEQRDAAADKLQKSDNASKAEEMRYAHEEKGRKLLNDVQQEHFDNPDALPSEKVPEEFKQRWQAQTADELQSSSANPDLGRALSLKYAEVDGKLGLEAQSWVFGRQAAQIKSRAYTLGQDAVKAAQSKATLDGLSVAIKDYRKSAAPLLPQVHGADAAKVAGEATTSMAEAWVEANGPNNPGGVRAAVDAAIKTQSGPLWDNIPAHKLVGYQKSLDGWGKGYGERQRSQVAAEAVDFNTKTLGAFQSKDLDSRNLYQLRDELQRKQFAIKANPQYKDNPDEKVRQSEIVQTQLDTLDALKNASQNGGHWDAKVAKKTTADLFKRFEDLSKSEQRSPNDLLKVLQVQRDLAQAQEHRRISPGDAETLTRSLKLLTGKSLSTKNGGAAKTGPLMSPIEPNQPRATGAAALDSYLQSGAYGKLGEDETAQMRVEYHRLSNDAQENGRNLDEKSAQKMALLAIQHVLTRSKKSPPTPEGK